MEPASITDYLGFIAGGAVCGAVAGFFAALPFLLREPANYVVGIFCTGVILGGVDGYNIMKEYSDSCWI